MMDKPTDIFKPVYRCSNCGALIEPEATKCENCSAMFMAVDVVDPVKVVPDKAPVIVKSYDYTDKDVIHRLIQSIPNGVAIANGIGGIGELYINHYIPMSETASIYDENVLTLKSLVRAMTLIRTEGYAPDTVLIHPFQMYDVFLLGEFIGTSERAFFTLPEYVYRSNIDGMIGVIGGMNIIVSEHMTAGQVIVFDSDSFPDNRSAGVLIYGGRTSIHD